MRSKGGYNYSRQNCKSTSPVGGAPCTQQFIAGGGVGGCFCFSVFQAAFLYDQPERRHRGHEGLDSNVIRVKSEELHQKT